MHSGAITQQTQNICITFCTTSAQRLRRWSNIVQMLYKCFVFTLVQHCTNAIQMFCVYWEHVVSRPQQHQSPIFSGPEQPQMSMMICATRRVLQKVSHFNCL